MLHLFCTFFLPLPQLYLLSEIKWNGNNWAQHLIWIGNTTTTYEQKQTTTKICSNNKIWNNNQKQQFPIQFWLFSSTSKKKQCMYKYSFAFVFIIILIFRPGNSSNFGLGTWHPASSLSAGIGLKGFLTRNPFVTCGTAADNRPSVLRLPLTYYSSEK